MVRRTAWRCMDVRKKRWHKTNVAIGAIRDPTALRVDAEIERQIGAEIA